VTTRPFSQTASALLTDLYQLTMLQSYYEQDMHETAVFEFFVRRLPENRNFLLFAGLEQVVGYLENLRFSEDELDWLRQSGRLNRAFIDDYLATFHFSGELHAMPEGTVFFPEEPVLRITAPLPEAQLIESRLINILHYQTLVASKAARCRLAAPEKLLIDFGLRRAHGAEAALFAARANYVAGFEGTATVEAERQFGIPIYGTMAHSYIQVHQSESEAFESYANSHPDNVVLLIDTYDTLAAADKVVQLAKSLREKGVTVNAVRLDSGDLGDVSRSVRRILDEGGEAGIAIFASGDLDEFRLAELVSSGCPIDAFGIGTRLNTSADSPSIDCVYKLQEYAGRPRRKRSVGKATWPGRKQVYRSCDPDGTFCSDLVTLDGDEEHDGEALIQPVMRDGKRISSAEPLVQIRERRQEQFANLPATLKELLAATDAYPVQISSVVRELADQVDSKDRSA
jgi:nicotinate phosphoribosyltransferase